MSELNTGRNNSTSGEDRRKKVVAAGGGVVDISQLSPDERAKFIADQEAEKEVKLGECCLAADKSMVKLKEVLEKDAKVCDHEMEFLLGSPVQIVADAKHFVPTHACGHRVDLVANVKPDAAGRRVLVIPPRGSAVVDCGFRMECPSGWQALFSLKDEFAEKGLVIPNAPNFFDHGRVKILLVNVSKGGVVNIDHNQKFAQMSMMPAYTFDFETVNTLERG